jgi:Uma2 family endonuclease
MSSAVKILPHYTYEDWLHWDGQWELIDGIPHAMSPMPVPEHQRIGGNLFTEFRQALKSGKNNFKAYQPVDYRVSDETVLQPDMLVVCGDITKKYLDFAPALVVEILSPSTALKDRHSKFEIYQSQKVKYYLIVNCELPEVEVYELVDDVYKLMSRGKDVEYQFNLDDCEAMIDFRKVWE